MASYCFRPHQTWTQPVAALSSERRLWLEEEESLELRLRLGTTSWELGLRHTAVKGTV